MQNTLKSCVSFHKLKNTVQQPEVYCSSIVINTYIGLFWSKIYLLEMGQKDQEIQWLYGNNQRWLLEPSCEYMYESIRLILVFLDVLQLGARRGNRLFYSITFARRHVCVRIHAFSTSCLCKQQAVILAKNHEKA